MDGWRAIRNSLPPSLDWLAVRLVKALLSLSILCGRRNLGIECGPSCGSPKSS